ncbi:hypothetical protein CLOSTMETH_00688 [[Clostridium] methylpentosum DSM 5476]|uniref:Uncharacterized protein n=1 Tax=[Clostridium] methylpentosum DSM 5476 TaxID=537013 RepID=C0EA34_9FIRM|nr:hypothetical protein CLOSTMETH_00688 [[Clostridium] methylpentosum DSM 5476]
MKGLWRIVFNNIRNSVDKMTAMSTPQKIQNSLFKGIVHDTVKFIPQEIFASYTIGQFVGCVLPHLADEKIFFPFRFDCFPDPGDKTVRQFICDVQPIARRPEPQPVAQDTVLPTDKIDVIGIVLVKLRKRGESPPGLVNIGIFEKLKPVFIWAFRRVESACAVVTAILVKIDAVASGVAENSVQDDPNTAFFRLTAEVDKILFCAEQGIDLSVISSVITVVGMRLKNGIEINHCDAELLEIREFFLDSEQVAPKIVAVCDLPLLVWEKVGKPSPIRTQFTVLGYIRMLHTASAESIGKDLIENPAFDAAGGSVAGFINCELIIPAGFTVVDHTASILKRFDVADLVPFLQFKQIEVHTCIHRGKRGAVIQTVPLGLLVFHSDIVLILFAIDNQSD